MSKLIMAIDQGTTGSTALLIDQQGEIRGRSYREFPQYFPQPGWVEHDALEIWETTLDVARKSLHTAGITWSDVAAIGITNQRETTLIWDRTTGEPIHRAIVWQCRRTADICQDIKNAGHEEMFRNRTGLVLDPYFSGTKVTWLLDNVISVRERAKSGKLAFGTIDSWLIWNLTGGEVHVTDFTNASRTLMFNIHLKNWDAELCELLSVPMSLLPQVKSSSGIYGNTVPFLFDGARIPISGIVGDQQSALYGQGCWHSGMVKNTYGTGCFILMNVGDKKVVSKNGLLTTLACDSKGNPVYALEGSVFMAGATMQWLRDELGLIKSAAESEDIANSLSSNDGVYLVPAFQGLGAPYWKPNAKGAILGLTRGSNKAHIIRAALESMAYQTLDIIKAMVENSGVILSELRVDGGAAVNNFLMQFQADILNTPLDRPQIIETTAMGAAYLAGLAIGYWKDPSEIEKVRRSEKKFYPNMSTTERNRLILGWQKAVDKVITDD